MKISVAVLLLALLAAPVLAAPPSGLDAPGGVLVAFSGQDRRDGQADTTGQDGQSGRNGAGQGDPSGRSDRVVIKGKGGKVTGVERKPAQGDERDAGDPHRQ